jgi:hypothetical protein
MAYILLLYMYGAMAYVRKRSKSAHGSQICKCYIWRGRKGPADIFFGNTAPLVAVLWRGALCCACVLCAPLRALWVPGVDAAAVAQPLFVSNEPGGGKHKDTGHETDRGGEAVCRPPSCSPHTHTITIIRAPL